MTHTNSDTTPILVWSFYDAPEHLQALSGHGGDEDWLAVVPARYADAYIPWLDSPSFGCCDVSTHTHPDYPGATIYIGAHA